MGSENTGPGRENTGPRPGSFVAAVCQFAPGTDPEPAVLEAVRSGASLVVLPGDPGVGPIPGSAPIPGASPIPGSGADRPDREEVLAAYSGLARRTRCYLVSGTLTLAGPARGSLLRVSWLIGPGGELLGEQVQTHTTAREESLGYRRGRSFDVFPLAGDLDGVRVGLLVGTDVWVPECSRILTLKGANILVAPLAMPSPYSELRQVAGVWQEVQQNQTFGLEACLAGPWGEDAFEGRSAITAPCEMTADESGFLARAADPGEPSTLLATIDLAARRAVIEAYDILAEMNCPLYLEGFASLYPAPAGDGDPSPGTPAGPALARPGPAFAQPRPALAQPGSAECAPAKCAPDKSAPAVGIGSDPPPGPRPGLPLAIKERAFRAYLTLAARPSGVRRAVRALGIKPGLAVGLRPGRAATGEPSRVVRVAALQLESIYARSVRDYVAWAGEPFREAVGRGAALVAFPELVTIPLIGLLPGVGPPSAAEGRPAGGEAAPAPSGTSAPRPRMADVIRFLEPVVRAVYFTLFSGLAAAGRVYVMAGSTPLPGPDGAVYNVQGLFAPDGRLLGLQRKLHLFPREKTEGLSPGSRLRVFETGVGRIALPICMDATYFETYRLAALLGAEIVSAPVSNLEPYDYWKLMRGALPRTQETPVYAIQSTIVGEFLGDPMTGKASIFAPAELTPAGDGLLDQCPSPTGPGLALADLDLEALAAFRERGSLLARLNPEALRPYLPGLYGDYVARRLPRQGAAPAE